MLAGCALVATACSAPAAAQEQRYVIADQDASGPGGSDMMSLLVFLQSPKVNLLGITVVTGDSWRDPEVAHALRLLEIVGRTDVKKPFHASTPGPRLIFSAEEGKKYRFLPTRTPVREGCC